MIEASLLVAGSAVAVALGGNVIVGVGLIKTWRRNGADAASKYGALQNEVKTISVNLNGMSKTVVDIDKKVDHFQLHCADVSGRMDERLHAVERAKPK